jgi:hypothetical protein
MTFREYGNIQGPNEADHLFSTGLGPRYVDLPAICCLPLSSQEFSLHCCPWSPGALSLPDNRLIHLALLVDRYLVTKSLPFAYQIFMVNQAIYINCPEPIPG